MDSPPSQGLNLDALLISAITYASEAVDTDTTAEALSAALFGEMIDLARQAGVEELILGLPRTPKQPKPVRDTRIEVSELDDDKLVQWTRYVSNVLFILAHKD